jgi:hypothetical protein
MVSALMVFCFAIGLFLESFPRMDPSSGGASPPLIPSNWSRDYVSTTLRRILIVLFTVTFLSRYWLSRFMFGPWFFTDEFIESCINPFRLAQGESLWGGYTSYLTYSMYLTSYRLFWFSPQVARATNIFSFAISVTILYWAMERSFGKKVSWFITAMILLSSPLITHSIYAASIAYSLLPTAAILFILTRPLALSSALILGPALVAGLYLYPAAFLTCACLIFFHGIVFYPSWRWPARAAFLASFALSGGLSYYLRFLLTQNTNLEQWAGGLLSFEHIVPNSARVLKDVFWESDSWDAVNHGAPYLDTVIIGFLIIGIVSSFLLSKSQLSTFERKWVWIGLLTFFGSVVLSALARDYPGVRRVFSSLPLLFLIAGLGLKYFWRWKTFRPCLAAVIIVCFGLVALRSYVISQLDWPSYRYWTKQPDFMMGARQALLESTNAQKKVVLISYSSDGHYRGHQYLCALSLDENLNQYFQTVTVIRREQLDHKQNLQGEFVLLANELFSEKQLHDAFGRPPSSTRIRKPSTSPRLDELVAIYEFTGDLQR